MPANGKGCNGIKQKAYWLPGRHQCLDLPKTGQAGAGVAKTQAPLQYAAPHWRRLKMTRRQKLYFYIGYSVLIAFNAVMVSITLDPLPLIVVPLCVWRICVIKKRKTYV